MDDRIGKLKKLIQKNGAFINEWLENKQKKNKKKTIVFDTSKTKHREKLFIRTRKQMKPYYVNEQKVYYILHEFSKFINVLIARESE